MRTPRGHGLRTVGTAVLALALAEAALGALPVAASSVQRVAPHVGPNATAAEPVTFQDRDRDGNLSGSDVFQIWDETSSLQTFSVRWGPNETSAYASVGFTLVDGYETQCIAPPYWGVDGTVLVVGIVLLVSVIVLVVFIARHASKR